MKEQNQTKSVEILKRAYERLQLPNTSKPDAKPFKPQRPDEPVFFRAFNIPETRKKSSQKTFFSKVLAFIDLQKHLRYSEGTTIIPIACTSKKMKSIFGNPMAAQRAIKKMIEIGLLAEYDETYQFNAYKECLNSSKKYAYNIVAEREIKEYCVKNQINKYIIINNIKKRRNNNNTSIVNTFANTIKSFEPDQVKFCSKLQLLKPDNYTETQFEDYLTGLLHINYPQLEEYQDLADYINETYFADDLSRQIVFQPTFTWNTGRKAVTKIGIRATNSLVSAKKTKDEDDPEWMKHREDILQEYGLTYEYDVKSSVPRVTYLMNNGHWLDDSIDLYEDMFLNFLEETKETCEWNKETREVFKSFHMRAYFDTEESCAGHLCWNLSKKGNYKREDWAGLKDTMLAYKRALYTSVGAPYDSEIFFHESCIYMKVLKELLERGEDVLQIYDGFYLRRQTEVRKIVKEKAEEYYKETRKKECKQIINNVHDITIVNTFAATHTTLPTPAHPRQPKPLSYEQFERERLERIRRMNERAHRTYRIPDEVAKELELCTS